MLITWDMHTNSKKKLLATHVRHMETHTHTHKHTHTHTHTQQIKYKCIMNTYMHAWIHSMYTHTHQQACKFAQYIPMLFIMGLVRVA